MIAIYIRSHPNYDGYLRSGLTCVFHGNPTTSPIQTISGALLTLQKMHVRSLRIILFSTTSFPNDFRKLLGTPLSPSVIMWKCLLRLSKGRSVNYITTILLKRRNCNMKHFMKHYTLNCKTRNCGIVVNTGNGDHTSTGSVGILDFALI